MSRTYIIVGAGLAGLFAARTLRHFGIDNIYVIEKASHVGGLLQTMHVEAPLQNGTNYDFDFGTHFVLSTADPDVDALLHQDMHEDKYYEYHNSLYEGHYLGGALYQESGCANISHFSQDVQFQIKTELAHAVEKDSSEKKYVSLYDMCLEKYGITANETIFTPAFKKLTDHHPQELSPEMELSFFPPRLIIANRKESIRLKQDPAWDKRIAFSDCEDGQSEIIKFYPKTGGIGKWLETMAKNLQKEGVNIKTNCTLQDIDIDNENIKKAILSDGQEILCDHLFWSLPPIFLGIMAGLNLPSQKPSMRSVGIINFLTDKRPIERPYWVTVYDPSLLSFRVTLYDNFIKSSHKQKVHKITVEILHDGTFHGTQTEQNKIFGELKTMNIVPRNTNILWSGSANKSEGFPILTPTLMKTTMKQIEILENRFYNLSIVGRRPDKHQGQVAVMKNVYETINNRLF